MFRVIIARRTALIRTGSANAASTATRNQGPLARARFGSTVDTIRANFDDDSEPHELRVGENLRSELLKAGFPLYNASAKFVNCGGHGLCGTCAVEVRILAECMTL